MRKDSEKTDNGREGIMYGTFKRILKDWLIDCGLFNTDHYVVSMKVDVDNSLVIILTTKPGTMIGKQGIHMNKYRKIFGYYNYSVKVEKLTIAYSGLKGT